MGRFESPCQVVGLFLAASILSVGIIFFINAEAHNRLSSRNELADFTVETNDGAPLSLPLSSSKFVSSSLSSELKSRYATDSNYTSSSPSLTSSEIGLDEGATNNVTLLNFLEDGLEKLLSLIKQAKNTYKSYYLHHASHSAMDSHNDDEENGTISPAGLHHPRRRKKRETTDSASVTIKNGRSGSSVSGSRLKRAVISPNKRRRIGENEPYYWQMLEDNNSENHHNHQHHQREKEETERRDKTRERSRQGSASSSSGRGHYSNSQYPHYHNHHNQKEPVNENHYFGSSSGSIPGPGHAPAVASAFTGGAETVVHSVHNPSSDFHKIRHAMNKLGGGGLDISVVERMILDTKSSGRGHSSGASRDQEQQRFNRISNGDTSRSRGYPPVSLSGMDHSKKSREDEQSPLTPSSSLLTTAITKTTQQGRQDDSVYVNQLRHHQQQLAQSLLPPTVTWLNEGGDGTSVRYLPLPSSSLATGSEDEDDDDDDEDDGDDQDGNVEEEGNSSQDDNDDDDSDSNENSVSRKGKNKASTRRMKMKRKKIVKAQRKNNELSYFPQPSSSSTSNEDDDEEVYQLQYGKGDDSQRNNNNDNSDNNNINSYGDRNNDMLGEEEEEEMEREAEESKRMEEDILQGNPPTPHYHEENGGKSHNGKDCYHTDDVLIVVAITCCLNFAFVLVIWALVRWFSISSNPKEKDFQNLGDCDDTLDPTIVFHGVTEDPCWTLATASGAGGAPKDGSSSSGMMATRSNNLGGGSGGNGANMATGGGGGMVGMIGSIHSVNKVDLFPTMGKYVGGVGSGVCASSIGSHTLVGGVPVMTMTAERRHPYQNNLHIGSGGMIGLGGGTLINGANIYSFKPEHVPAHHGSSGTMHRSYSQSMEDLRYLE